MESEESALISPSRKLIFIISLLSISLFHLLTIRQGHVWGGDFSMYIHHAINIVEGAAYDDTGYIFNPFNPTLAPTSTPPLFPLVLGPVYRVFGLDLTAMKVVPIAAFLLALIPAFFLLKSELSYSSSLMAVLFLGLNPFFWDFKDDIRPDNLFLLLTYLTLYVVHKRPAWLASSDDRAWHGLGVGILLYLGYATRTAGILMPVALVAYDLIRRRRLQKLTLRAIITFTLLTIAQFLMMPGDGHGYPEQFTLQWQLIVIDLISYPLSLAAIWDNGHIQLLQVSVFVAATSLALLGFARRLRNRVSIIEVYIVVYIVGLLVWPTYQGVRYLIPIIPLYIFYMLVSLEHLHTLVDSGRVNRPLLLFAAIVFTSYAAKYSTVDFRMIREGIGDPKTVALFEHVKANTDEDSVFIFAKPRVLALFTNRRAAVFHDEKYLDVMWSFWEEIGADYIVTRENDPAYWLGWVHENQHRMKERYRNEQLQIYEILSEEVSPGKFYFSYKNT